MWEKIQESILEERMIDASNRTLEGFWLKIERNLISWGYKIIKIPFLPLNQWENWKQMGTILRNGLPTAIPINVPVVPMAFLIQDWEELTITVWKDQIKAPFRYIPRNPEIFKQLVELPIYGSDDGKIDIKIKVWASNIYFLHKEQWKIDINSYTDQELLDFLDWKISLPFGKYSLFRTWNRIEFLINPISVMQKEGYNFYVDNVLSFWRRNGIGINSAIFQYADFELSPNWIKLKNSVRKRYSIWHWMKNNW